MKNTILCSSDSSVSGDSPKASERQVHFLYQCIVLMHMLSTAVANAVLSPPSENSLILPQNH